MRILVNDECAEGNSDNEPDDLSLSVPHGVGTSRIQLEVQQHIVCRFAPAGRDVYSLAVLSLVRSSVGAQSLLPDLARFRCQVSLLTERDLWACARSYRHLAPLERKRIQLLHS